VKEILIEVCNCEKDGVEEMIGFTRMGIDEIYEKAADEKGEYLIREDGLRTRSKVNFSYKLEPSKVNRKESKSFFLKFEGGF